MAAETMRAVLMPEYGGPEVLMLADVAKPRPKPREVLVRVHAASVNPIDWKIRTGGQRNIIRYRLPWILGLDCSGVVEAVGAKVTRFEPGDEIWSSPRHSRPGTYADYTCIDEREVALKPTNISHVEAASMPLVALTAYQCLLEKGCLESGQRVLVHAGSGGVGSFAIQLAKMVGAHVITTCSAKNEAYVRGLGADEVVDYRSDNFADVLEPVDLVLDSLGEPVFDDNVRVLRRGGRMSNITVDVTAHVERYGTFGSLFSLAFAMTKLHVSPWLTKRVKTRHVIKRCDGRQLEAIAAFVQASKILPTVETVLPLEEVQEAHRHSESHRARGKIVLRVVDD